MYNYTYDNLELGIRLLRLSNTFAQVQPNFNLGSKIFASSKHLKRYCGYQHPATIPRLSRCHVTTSIDVSISKALWRYVISTT